MRRVAVGVTLGTVVLLTACSSAGRTPKHVLPLPLPASVQPPDPCELINGHETSSTLGVMAKGPAHADLQRGFARTCKWSVNGDSAVVLDVYTAAALSWPHAPDPAQLDHVARPTDAQPFPVGDDGWFVENGADAQASARSGLTLVQLTLHSRFSNAPRSDAIALLRLAIAALPR